MPNATHPKVAKRALTVKLSVVLPTLIHDALVEAATVEGRSVSSAVRVAVAAYAESVRRSPDYRANLEALAAQRAQEADALQRRIAALDSGNGAGVEGDGGDGGDEGGGRDSGDEGREGDEGLDDGLV